MKKIVLIIMGFIIFGSAFSQSGCPTQTNILNPDLTVCGLYGDNQGNSLWDWELNNPQDPNYCRNWYAKVPNSTNLIRMGSPFVNPGNGRIKIISDANDYKKSKGWELLQRKFGCYSDVANPYFVLYNRYTGVMRVYVYITAGSGVYSQLMMRVRSVTTNRPATLSQANDLMETPREYINGTTKLNSDEEVLVSISDAVGNASWSVGEFVTTLDHNIANFIYSNASLEISVYGVTNSTLKAKISGMAISSASAEDFKDGMFIKKNAGTTGSSFNFQSNSEKLIKFSKELPKFVAGINKSALAVVSSIAPVIPSTPKYKAKIAEKASAVAALTYSQNSFSKEVNKFSKFLGTAGEILGFAGKIYGFFEPSASTAAPAPTYTSYNLELDGQIQSQVVVTNFVIKTPATLTPPSNNNNATYYNCNFGTFNLKRKPIIEYLEYERRALMPGNISPRHVPKTIKYTGYRVKEEVQLVINDGADLELVEAEGALVAYTNKSLAEIQGTTPITLNPLERHPDRGNYTYFNHMYADILANRLKLSNFDISGLEMHTIQTPFYNMKCIKNAVINITDNSLSLFFRVRALMRKKGDFSGELLYFINDYEVERVQGDPNEIPMDITYNLSAFPPYRNYMIPPNVQSVTRTTQTFDSYWQDAAADDYVVDQYPSINQANARYNHSIVTNPAYYTTIANPTNGVVTFRAGAYIELNPKFETQLGARFLATIDFGYFDLPCYNDINLTLYQNSGNCYVTTLEAQKADVTENNQNEIKVFPNPVKDYLNIQLRSFNEIRKVELINSLGKVTNVDFQVNKKLIKLNSLSKFINGHYVVIVYTNEGFLSKKIQIIN